MTFETRDPKPETRAIMIAATHSGTGKTTITCALIKALQNKGLKIASFKNGPDYIDPTYHAHISGKPCRNLDSWLMPEENLEKLLSQGVGDSDLAIIEGSMGLFDGRMTSEAGSSAHLAKILKAKVFLIVDASSFGSSCAALVHGFNSFDKDLEISGVILNKVASPRHLEILENAIKKAGVPLIGWLPRNNEINFKKRHLGLHLAGEIKELDEKINAISKQIEQNFDLGAFNEKVSEIATLTSFARNDSSTINPLPSTLNPIKIGVAYDSAFNFYYQDNLDLLKQAGAEIVFFSPLKDKELPKVNGLYFGGGYPELHAQELAANAKLKTQIKEAIESNMPVYAECGGFLYLSKELITDETQHKMVGAFNTTSTMQSKLVALGYAKAKPTKTNILAQKDSQLKGHRFHYSKTSYPTNNTFAYTLENGEELGCIYKNTLASYLHLHFGSDFKLAENFVTACKEFS